MGRTLHFQVLEPERLTDKHLEACYTVSEQYNAGVYADIWSCENFYLDPLACYPNWGGGQDWASWGRRYDELREQGCSELETRRQLVAEGVARLHNPGDLRGSEPASDLALAMAITGSHLMRALPHATAGLRGFCKTRGDDVNAVLVVAALTELSRRLPATIRLSDEGDTVRVPLLIRDGLAAPTRMDPATVPESQWQHPGRYCLLPAPAQLIGCPAEVRRQVEAFCAGRE